MSENLAEARESGELAEILRAVRAQRSRLDSFLTDHRQKTQQLGSSLQSCLDEFAGQYGDHERQLEEREVALERTRQELEAQRAALEESVAAREEALAQREAAFAEREAEFTKRQSQFSQREAEFGDRECKIAQQETEIEQRQSELLERAAEVDEEVARVAQERQDLDSQKTLLAEEIQQLAERREHLQEKLAELDAEREECTALQERTEEQRRHLAEKMQARRKELQEQQAQMVSASGMESLERLPGLERELGESRQRIDDLEAELNQAKAEAEALKAAGGASGEERKQLEQLAQACRELERRNAADAKKIAALEESLRQSQQELETAKTSAGEGGEGGDEYRQRYEMALSDLREERARVSELEGKLARAKTSGAAVDDGGAMDWEAQKRRLLAALESDFDDDSSQSQEDKLTLQEAIRLTDEAVAAKERELDQLQRLLEEQSSNVGNMAVGAAAVAELLDTDELIRQERENLQQIQQEWRDKLRQSEIDISLERARLARDRAQLEEQIRELESEAARVQKNGGSNAPEDKKAARGNWLTRMGLKGDS